MYITTVVLAVISFASTLASAIWSSILHYQSSKRCQIPAVLTKYNNEFTCTRELATCVMLPVIRKTDDAARRLACVETVRLNQEHKSEDRMLTVVMCRKLFGGC